jgi:hypothetical protein
MSKHIVDEDLYLHIKDINHYTVITFYLSKDRYMSVANENAFDSLPKNIERSLISKKIIECIEIDFNIYYILHDIKCDIKIYDIMVTVKNTNKSEDIETSSSISRSSSTSRHDYRFNEDDSTSETLSTIMKPSSTRSRTPSISSESRLDKDDYKLYIAESTRSSYSTPTYSGIKKREYVSPEDYKARTETIRSVKRKFKFEEYNSADTSISYNLIGLFAKEDNGNIYIYDGNNGRLTSNHRLFKQVPKDKLMQAKYIIKGYFNLNTCVLSEKTGLITINNITMDEFIEQITPALMMM